MTAASTSPHKTQTTGNRSKVGQPVAGQTGQHGLTEHSDGAWSTRVPIQTRSERFTSFDVSDFPDVTGREPMWKFTPVSEIDDLISGQLDGSRYEFDATSPAGITIEWSGRDDDQIGRVGKPEEKASANAWSQFTEALMVTITGEDEKECVITREQFGKNSNPKTSQHQTQARAAHTVITAEPFSRSTIIFRNAGLSRLTENVEISVEEGAALTVVSIQEWDDSAVHLASHFATIGRNASLTHIVVSLSGKIVRVNPSVLLRKEGSEVDAFGVYFSSSGQHCEQQVFVNHDAPHTRSRVNYKGALQGEKARSVWIGDVLIGRKAVGTDSYEQNRNLILSDGARADSIPNLEIETGDIVGAGHASATGRFDDEQLFYLQARGIPENEARRLVVLGFLAEIVQQIGSPDLEQHLQGVLEAQLESTPKTTANPQVHNDGGDAHQ